MNYISYTHFRTRGLIGTLLFQWHVMRSRKQANQSKGLLGMHLWHSSGTNFHTLTSWQSKEAMQAFRNSGAHRLAMQLSAKMGQGYTVGWYSDAKISPREAEYKLWEKLNGQGNAAWLGPEAPLRA